MIRSSLSRAFFLGLALVSVSPPVWAQDMIRIHAIPLRDSNGGRPYTVTVAQVQGLVVQLNIAFAPADLAFVFDPAFDWTPMDDTGLNSMVNDATDWWTRPNEVAARFPGKMVVFFRWGGTSPVNPAGGAFAYPPDIGLPKPNIWHAPTPVNFIAFMSQSGAVANFVRAFPHEVGHYIGLYHTFLDWNDTVTDTLAEAQAMIAAAGGKAKGLDGDLLSDTPPEAGTAFYVNNVNANPCGPPGNYVISNITFTPARQNIMSYFQACQPPYQLTAQQIARIRATLNHPSRALLIRPPCSADFHNLPADRFQACFDYWANRGLFPVTLSTYGRDGGISMAGSFQSVPNRPVRHLITPAQFDSEFTFWLERGFRPDKVVVLPTTSGLRYTAIWAPLDGAFQSHFALAPAQYDPLWHRLRSQNYLQTDLWAYEDGGTKFAATWVQKPFVDYAHYYGMTSEQYNARFVDFWRRGLRVTHFVAYPTSSGFRYAAIWEHVPGAWAHFYGMTSDQYQARYNAFAAEGFRLHQVQGYGAGRFSAIWTKR